MIAYPAAAALFVLGVGLLWWLVRQYQRGELLDRALDPADDTGPGLMFALLVALGAELIAAALVVAAISLALP